MSIIVVDDEYLAAQRLFRLQEEGITQPIAVFHDPQQAYQYAEQRELKLAFLDISMPTIDGISLVKLLHKLQPSFRIVFVTGNKEYAIQAFDIGVVDYILKPVMKERLHTTIQRMDNWNELMSQSFAMKLSVRLFDQFILTTSADGQRQPLKLRSPKTEELFAFLLCRKTVSKDLVIDVLWPNMTPEKAWKNLNSNLYYIRKSLDARVIPNCMTTSGSEIKIDAKAYDWAMDEAYRLERSYIHLLEHAAKAYEEAENLLPELECYQHIIALDHLREDIHRQIIRIYYLLDRRNDAILQTKRLQQITRELDETMPN
ncbi:response regulator [Paenibacillus yanchengensis]|uniref:Response regulator n=1 Tax=Paenibacillus yanchengensis TaxID=2035833 RepID=A0ABW4YPR2_9BACL